MRRSARLLAATLVLLAAGCTASAQPASRTPPSRQPDGPRPAATATPPRSAEPAPSGPRTVTILGSGDVLIHPPLWQQAARDARAEGRTGYDFGPMYAGIAADVQSADLAICEMESPLAPPHGPFAGWPTFSSPPQVLRALKRIGYESCTTASNHTYDQGYAGIRRTLDELDAAGLRHTGSARTAAEAHQPLIIRMPNGVRVAQLAYTFNLNGLRLPAGEPWLANVTDIPEILEAAARAKRAGADVVVVSMHWGVEYDQRASALQRQQARELLSSPDVDLVLGDHAHVVQPAERIAGKWVIYCMGNQISRHADPVLVSREGAMPRFTFTEIRPGRFRVTAAR